MSKKQVVYFYEGETEKTLLEFLKAQKQIKSGKTKKFNLWKNRSRKIKRTINETDELFFIIDTDKTDNKDIFLENIKLLKDYKVCLIVQNKNLEDELLFACNIKNYPALFDFFYQVEHLNKFKTKFAQDENLLFTLSKNNFDCKKLWSRSDNFSDWLKDNHIEVNIDCNYKEINCG